MADVIAFRFVGRFNCDAQDASSVFVTYHPLSRSWLLW